MTYNGGMSGYHSPDMPKINKSSVASGLDGVTCIDPLLKQAVAAVENAAKTSKSQSKRKRMKRVLNALSKFGDAMVEINIGYLEACYQEMWDVSSYYSGNLRGSLDIIGDLKNDPYHAEIDLNMEKFLEPKILTNVREVTTRKDYTRHRDGTEVTYEYKFPVAYLDVKRNGTDYSEIQENTNITSKDEPGGPEVGGPFIHSVWKEIRKKQFSEWRDLDL